MLPDRLSQLLTAYIDGELSARQRKLVQRLLQRSAAARELLQKLRNDAEALHSLPRVKLEDDLSRKVLRAITERRMQVTRRTAFSSRSAFPNWAGAVAAASVLLSVFCGSYLYFAATQTPRDPMLASSEAPTPHKRTGDDEIAETPMPVPMPMASDAASGLSSDLTLVTPKLPLPRPDFLHPIIPPAENPEHSVEARPSGKFETLEEIYKLPIALSLSLRNLDQRKTRAQLVAELRKEEAFRLEVFTLGTSITFERVKAAFEAQGIRLLIDQLALFRLKNQGWKTDYLFYVEGITQEELARILEKLGAEDHKAEAVLLSLTASDHQELSRVLGVDPTKLDPPRKGPHGVDIRKPLAQMTAEQLRQAPPRPTPGVSAAKPLTRQALVVSYNPVRPKPAASKEIKIFLDHRTERKPGTLQLLLVLREANG